MMHGPQPKQSDQTAVVKVEEKTCSATTDKELKTLAVKMSENELIIANKRLQESSDYVAKADVTRFTKDSAVQNTHPEAPQPALESNEKCRKLDASSSIAAPSMCLNEATPSKIANTGGAACKKTRREDFATPTIVKPKRQRRSIGQVLSEAVFQNMLRCQNEHLHYCETRKYIKYRRVLVDWLAELGTRFQLEQGTVHVAMLLLDRLLQGTVFDRRRLQLFGICCLMIAAKFEELELNVPLISQLKAAVGGCYTAAAIAQTELQILFRLNWNLREFAPIHFLNYYYHKGVLFRTDKFVAQVPNERELLQNVKKYFFFFAEIAMQHYKFQQYPSSVAAAAVVRLTRRCLGVCPEWKPELARMAMGHDLHADSLAEECARTLWAAFKEEFPEQVQRVEQRKRLSQEDESPVSVMALHN